MLWLAGLMGMMVLGSVAVISTSPLDEEEDAQDSEQPDAIEGDGEGTVTSFMSLGLFEQTGAINANQVPQDEEDIHTETGGDQTDLMDGTDGDDLLDGAGGDDEMRSGNGNDTLSGGTGNDTLHGELGDDLMRGDAGRDAIFGHDGDDDIEGGDGDDALSGGMGDDVVRGGTGNDSVEGNIGNDTLTGGVGQDALFGGDGDDLLLGSLEPGEEGDYLNGGDGADMMVAGSGDILTGGTGSDIFSLSEDLIDEAADLRDFNIEDDRLLIVYDDSDPDADPELELRLSEDDPTTTEIVVNGAVLGLMPTEGAPPLQDVVLVGTSAAGLLPGV